MLDKEEIDINKFKVEFVELLSTLRIDKYKKQGVVKVIEIIDKLIESGVDIKDWAKKVGFYMFHTNLKNDLATYRTLGYVQPSKELQRLYQDYLTIYNYIELKGVIK